MFFEEMILANQRARGNLWGNEVWFFCYAQQKAPKASASAQTITIKWTETKLENNIFGKIKMSNSTELSLYSIEPDLVKPRSHLNIVIALLSFFLSFFLPRLCSFGDIYARDYIDTFCFSSRSGFAIMSLHYLPSRWIWPNLIALKRKPRLNSSICSLALMVYW